MASLKDVLSSKIPALRTESKELAKKYSDKKVQETTIAQIFGGMRGIKGLICDTSEVSPDKGLLIRKKPLSELNDYLPEEIFYLLLTGDRPNAKDLKDLQKDLMARSTVPDYVWNVLKSLPNDFHPMKMLITAILILEADSKFSKLYNEGMKKEDYWIPALEDSLNLLSKLPVLAAGIYNIRYKDGKIINPDPSLDWAANYAYMLGFDKNKTDVADLMRLFFVLHSDHEGGNVSAHTSDTVGSSLSDPYYAIAAGLSGLAGPLHGLANQECLKFLISIQKHFGGVPQKDELKTYLEEKLSRGQVIPGYGHAVLRVTDPRFTALYDFGKKVCQDDLIFKMMERLYEVAPGVLKAQGKVKDPYPNVDAGSGVLLYHYGITEFSYYTVLFSVGRSMGLLAQLVLARAMGRPIIRPKSVTTEWIKDFVSK